MSPSRFAASSGPSVALPFRPVDQTTNAARATVAAVPQVVGVFTLDELQICNRSAVGIGATTAAAAATAGTAGVGGGPGDAGTAGAAATAGE